MAKYTDPTQMYETTFQHVHFSNGFTVLNKKPKTTHACMQLGYWCTDQIKEHPTSIFIYLMVKFKTLYKIATRQFILSKTINKR